MNKNTLLEVLKDADDLQQQSNVLRKSAGMSIRKYRKNELKVSLRKLASQLGISAMFLSDIERGNRYISPKIVDKL